jgi:hypothetical protein
MTERIDIAKAREMFDGTTQGEWRVKEDREGNVWVSPVFSGEDAHGYHSGRYDSPSDEDALWIAHAHNTYAALLDELEGVRDIVERNQYLSGVELAKLAVITKEYPRLTEDNARLQSELAALRVEKEAALDTMEGWRARAEAAEGDIAVAVAARDESCLTCKHEDKRHTEEPCYNCTATTGLPCGWQCAPRLAAELLASRERIKENDETFALMDAQNIRLTADNAGLTAWKEKAREAMRLMRKSLYMSKGYLDAMTAMSDLIGGRDAPEPPEVQS